MERGNSEIGFYVIKTLRMAKGGEKSENLAESLGTHSEHFNNKFLELLRKERFIGEKQGAWYTTERGEGMLEFCEKCHKIIREIREKVRWNSVS